ncbi:MAG: ester cyclase [Chloroflexaceae bacterium]
MADETIRNKYIAMRYFKEIMTDGNLATLYELIAPDFVFTLPTHPEPYRGPDGFKELVTMLHSCFPDFYIHPQDMVAFGDTVVTRWLGGGTHLGAAIHTVAGDIPASGRTFEIDGISWQRMANGQIVETHGNEDTVGMFSQLGILRTSPLLAENPDQNLKTTHIYFNEIMSQGKLELIEEIMTPDFQFIIPTQPAPIAGYDNMKGFVTYLRTAFPDITFTVEREIAGDNKVASRWRIKGTHKGEFLGMPASGNVVEDYGIDIFTFEQGKIKTVHVNENDFGLFQQLQA